MTRKQRVFGVFSSISILLVGVWGWQLAIISSGLVFTGALLLTINLVYGILPLLPALWFSRSRERRTLSFIPAKLRD